MVFCVFQFVSITSHPVTDHHGEESGCAFFTPSIRDLYPLLRSPRVFACPGWADPSLSLLVWWMLQALDDPPGPSLRSHGTSLHSPMQERCSQLSCTSLNTAFQVCVTSAEWRGRIPSLELLAALPDAAQDGGLLCLKDTFLAPGQLVPCQDPQGLQCKAALQPVGPWLEAPTVPVSLSGPDKERWRWSLPRCSWGWRSRGCRCPRGHRVTLSLLTTKLYRLLVARASFPAAAAAGTLVFLKGFPGVPWQPQEKFSEDRQDLKAQPEATAWAVGSASCAVLWGSGGLQGSSCSCAMFFRGKMKKKQCIKGN